MTRGGALAGVALPGVLPSASAVAPFSVTRSTELTASAQRLGRYALQWSAILARVTGAYRRPMAIARPSTHANVPGLRIPKRPTMCMCLAFRGSFPSPVLVSEVRVLLAG